MTAVVPSRGGFRHEALFYCGESDFVDATLPFIQQGLAGGEPIMVAVLPTKAARLRCALGPASEAVTFVDMGVLGRNPARIMGAWQEFVAQHAVGGQFVRGIGEPVGGISSSAHLVECQIHESLLNTAFADSVPWSLLCPYDTTVLDEGILQEARRSHPRVVGRAELRGEAQPDATWDPLQLLSMPLPEPSRHSGDLTFRSGELQRVCGFVAHFAQRFGMDPDRAEALVVATHEVASNSLRHGGGEGVLRMWRDGDYLVCELRDRGHFDDPLVGRRAPQGDGPRGLWSVNRLCDLVQIRNRDDGAVVRLHMALAGVAEQRLTHLTLHDQLTGLGNRTMLRTRLTEALDRAERRHAVLFCDLDDLKLVNDTYGHRVGDEVLVAVAGRLREGARPGDTIARLGGDEFVVLCEDVSSEADAQLIARRVAQALDARVKTSAGALALSVSIGVALSRPGQSADDLLAEADAAMYADKRARTTPPAG